MPMKHTKIDPSTGTNIPPLNQEYNIAKAMPNSAISGLLGMDEKTPGTIIAPNAVQGMNCKNLRALTGSLSFDIITNGKSLGI
ncbi:MAG: hypothetical protein K0R54_1086 [Clostridiaceae bacterium]|jgi:hypothetical protein|nr:hypothetical protein [Clostridiaceae bacterium]